MATLLIAWVVLREAVDRRLVLGASAIIAGAAVLSCGREGARLAGDPAGGGLLVAAARLCWGIDSNLSRRLSVAGIRG